MAVEAWALWLTAAPRRSRHRFDFTSHPHSAIETPHIHLEDTHNPEHTIQSWPTHLTQPCKSLSILTAQIENN